MEQLEAGLEQRGVSPDRLRVLQSVELLEHALRQAYSALLTGLLTGKPWTTARKIEANGSKLKQPGIEVSGMGPDVEWLLLKEIIDEKGKMLV